MNHESNIFSTRRTIGNSFTNQVKFHSEIDWRLILASLSATDYGPCVRSYDESNGRTVFQYNPESCGYVRERVTANIASSFFRPISSFDRVSVAIAKAVGKQLFNFEGPTILH